MREELSLRKLNRQSDVNDLRKTLAADVSRPPFSGSAHAVAAAVGNGPVKSKRRIRVERGG